MSLLDRIISEDAIKLEPLSTAKRVAMVRGHLVDTFNSSRLTDVHNQRSSDF